MLKILLLAVLLSATRQQDSVETCDARDEDADDSYVDEHEEAGHQIFLFRSGQVRVESA